MAKSILHISTHDSGGAGLAAYRIHKKFRDNGFTSHFVVKYKSVLDADVIEVIPGLAFRIYRKLKGLFKRSMKIVPKQEFYFFNLSEKENYFPVNDLLTQIPVKPDAIIIYWISNFVNAKNLKELQELTQARIYWYFLDMGPLTGGCHYFWNCENFLSHCGMCPALSSNQESDVAHKNFALKKRYLFDVNLTLLLGTKQLLSLVSKSPLFKDKSRCYIPIGIDTSLFIPSTDKAKLREKYGISKKCKVILIAAGDLQDKRKGIGLAIECLKLLTVSEIEWFDQVCVLIAGKETIQIGEEIPFQTHSLGFLTEASLAEAYQIADVFLCSTIEDAGPAMVMESLACGLPVIGFNVGIIPDIIKQNECGFVTEKGNVAEMTKNLEKLLRLSEEDLNNISKRCRQVAVESFDSEKQFKKLINLL